VAGHTVGADHASFFIAEAGVNHNNGDLGLAHRLIETAAANAVKFQTFKADLQASSDAPKAEYQKVHGRADERQLEMLRRLELDDNAYRELLRHRRELGLVFLSTPFEEQSADLLERM